MTVQKEGKRNAGTTNVFSEGELDRGSTVAKNATTQFENGNRKNNVHFFHDNGVKSVIIRHINNVFKESELDRLKSGVCKFCTYHSTWSQRAPTTEEIPNALIEQYEIDGHKLMEIIDELEEVEAV